MRITWTTTTDSPANTTDGVLRDLMVDDVDFEIVSIEYAGQQLTLVVDVTGRRGSMMSQANVAMAALMPISKWSNLSNRS